MTPPLRRALVVIVAGLTSVGCRLDPSRPTFSEGDVAIDEVTFCSADFFGCDKRTIWHVGERAHMSGVGVARPNSGTQVNYGGPFPDLFTTTWSISDSTVASLDPSPMTCLCVDVTMLRVGRATLTLTLAGKKGTPKSASLEVVVVAGPPV